MTLAKPRSRQLKLRTGRDFAAGTLIYRDVEIILADTTDGFVGVHASLGITPTVRSLDRRPEYDWLERLTFECSASRVATRHTEQRSHVFSVCCVAARLAEHAIVTLTEVDTILLCYSKQHGDSFELFEEITDEADAILTSTQRIEVEDAA